MSRYTVKAFKKELAYHNQCLADVGSLIYGDCSERNGMTMLNCLVLTADGELANLSCLGGGSPREAMAEAYRNLPTQARTPKKLTRQQCKAIMCLRGVDFTQDFYQLGLSEARLLGSLARKSGYRQPHANGSLARYFYEHLLKRVTVDFDYKFDSARGLD